MGDRGGNYILYFTANTEKSSLDVLFFKSLLSGCQHVEVSVCGKPEQSSRAAAVPSTLLGCSLRL